MMLRVAHGSGALTLLSRSAVNNTGNRVRRNKPSRVVRAALPAGDPKTVARFVEKTVGRASMAGLTFCGARSVVWTEQDPSLVVGVLAATTALIAYGTYKTDNIDVWPPRKPFTRGIETLNGRVAMLGVIAYMLHYNFQV